jgi:hypothetical protein
MYTVKIATIDEFRSSRDAWNNLASSIPIPSIFCTWEWIYTWWEHFGASYKPLILFVCKGSELTGILPLALYETFLNRECVAGRILTYCGSRELYPDHLDVITTPENAEPCIDAIYRFLSSEYLYWDVCDLKLLAEGSNLISWVGKARQTKNFKLDTKMKESSFARFIPLKGSFEDYINSFDTRQRYNLRSRRKKIEQQGFSYKSCDPLLESKGLDKLFEIHALRSKKKKIQSTFVDAGILEFHKSLAKRINDQGWISLRFLKNDNQIIAASYNFIYLGRVFSYQKGMDPHWERYGPGKAIVYEAIREAFESGSHEYNFLQGNEGYKSGWTGKKRILFTMTIFNNTLGGIFSKGLQNSKDIIKRYCNHSKQLSQEKTRR